MKSPIRSSLYTAAAAAAISTSGAEASALEVPRAWVDDEGSLEVEFVDDIPPNTQANYTLSATASALYVCVKQLRPLLAPRYRTAIETHVERKAPFTSTYRGRVEGVLTVELPMERSSLTCPIGALVDLAEVRYVKIQVQGEHGPPALGPDASRVFHWF
ncbi:hypothetical protein WMF30_27510 [Sorangium sp. So ce134]